MSTEPVCAACRQPHVEAAAGTGTPIDAGALPQGWRVRRIAGRDFTLCEVCGDIRHFRGGISTYLQENLGVGPHAVCEFADEPGSGLHRTRLGRRRGG